MLRKKIFLMSQMTVTNKVKDLDIICAAYKSLLSLHSHGSGGRVRYEYHGTLCDHQLLMLMDNLSTIKLIFTLVDILKHYLVIFHCHTVLQSALTLVVHHHHHRVVLTDRCAAP